MKRIMIMLVAVTASLVLGSQASLASEGDGLGPFADVDGSVHEGDIAAVWAAEITTGCDEWLFCPDEDVSRAQMAAFLARALELSPPERSMFTDTEASTFEAEIEAIAVADITAGCAPHQYCPDAPVTRGQMASLLVRALELPPVEGDPFTDDEHSIHERDIAALAAAGLTHGCESGSFCPDDPVTRAQMGSFLARAFQLRPPSDLPEIPSDVLAELEGPSWPTGPGAEGWRPLVEQYFPAGDVDRAIGIIACESKGDPRARNPRSGASGLFQHMPRYWDERASGAGFPGASIFDPEANVAAAAYLIYEHPGGGWQHWVCR